MNIGMAFGFVTEDEEWIKKILIGGLIFLGFAIVGSIIPGVASIPLYGYMFQAASNVYKKNPRPLPDWNNFGDILMKGLFYLLISIAYAIPLIIISGVFFLLTGGISSMGDGGETTGGILLLCFVPVIIILGLITMVITMAAFARYVQTDSLGAAFEINKIISMLKANPGLWGMLIVVNILAGIVAALGIIACGIGVLFTAVYASAVSGHALGQVVAQLDNSGGSSDIGIPPAYGSPM